MNFITKFFGSVFGVGFLPFIPGTFGSIFACVIFIFIPQFQNQVFFISFTAILLIFGIWIGNHADKIDKKDPCWFVLDEWVGQNIPLFIISQSEIGMISISFVLFRIFDISKILKINSVQKYRGGMGIMLDDVLAGIYSLLIVGGIKWFVM